eukprot:PhF_6_TR43524/c0_g1_i1/m.66813
MDLSGIVQGLLDICFGFQSAWSGLFFAITSSEVRSVIRPHCYLIIIFSLLIWLCGHLVLLPLRLLTLVLPSSEFDKLIEDASQGIHITLMITPFLWVFVARNVCSGHLATLFFEGLEDEAGVEMARSVRAMKVTSRIVDNIKRTCKSACYGILALIVFAIFPPLTTVFMFYKPIVKAKGIGFTWIAAVLWGVLCWYPHTRFMMIYLLEFYMMCRHMGRELMDSVAVRLETDKMWYIASHPYQMVLFGFSMGVLVLVQVPLIGPVLWFCGFYAAGRLYGNLSAQKGKGKL